ncbi:MAG: hypothetical protein SCALA702_13160 [Melioribacteraceae bacterium]|nr:MAG: hypothetical protein SCALA702_13160 [Melioribacteraceae bacterium]
MSDTAIHEMISAFAAGCMDEKNHLYFKEYLEESRALPDKKLGELQNIMALLPLLLEEEDVPPDLKKQVAKKLLSLQDEIKAKIQTEKRKTLSENPKSPLINDTPPKEEPKSIISETIPRQQPPEEEGEIIETPAFQQSGLNLQEKLERRKDLSLHSEEFVLNRNHWFGIFGLVTIIIAIIVALGLVYQILDSKIETVVDKFSGVESEITLNTDFRENYFSLMQFFNHSDIKYYNLVNIDAANNASAKVFLSIDGGSGIIQLSEMPRLADEQTFQLWIRTATRDYSLGTFLPNPGRQFQEIEELPAITYPDIEQLFISAEFKPGNNAPTGRMIIQKQVKEVTAEPEL